MRDRDTGRSRGFGFVTFSTDTEAQDAINNRNGTMLDNREVRVNLANPRVGGGGRGPERVPGDQGGWFFLLDTCSCS